MQVDGTNDAGFLDGLDVVLFEQIEDVFSNLSVVEISVHLGILGLDKYSCQSAIRVALAIVLLIESDHHLDDITEQREGKLIIKNGKSSRSLVLLNPQSLQLIDCESVSPPIGFVFAIIESLFDFAGELFFRADVCDAG